MARSWVLGRVIIYALIAAGCIAGGARASAAEEPAAEIRTLAERQALELAELRARYARALLVLSEAELQAALEQSQRAPQSVSFTQLQRLRAVVEASRIAARMAELAHGTPEVGKEILRLSLNQRVNVDVSEKPLEKFVNELRDTYRVNVLIDRKALDDAGIGLDTPVSIQLRSVPLRLVLKRALKQFDLTWLVDEDALLITTEDEASQRVETVIYPVYDLLVWDALDAGGSPGDLDYDALIELITSTVAPTSWDEVGGPGSIAPYLGNLVISQTQQVHEQIAELLMRLRRTRLSRGDRRGLFPVLGAGQ